jgi:hypothetical protein
LKVAVIAGEVSGDLLAADLVADLKAAICRPVELIGVGGEGLQAQGLRSLFDFPNCRSWASPRFSQASEAGPAHPPDGSGDHRGQAGCARHRR